MAAVAARIIPSDGSPGANEAGVIYFIDTVLADDREAEYAQLQEALEVLRQTAASGYGVNRFADLGEAQQDELLTSIETTPFFQTMRFLTIAGMFSLPAYGGNRDAVGYELIGFQSQHAWTAPYGYYDADYMEKGA
jgi:gluconate 2-dehydrogenase gamma chain